MTTISVCCVCAIFVATNVEGTRRKNFLSMYALDNANRDLAVIDLDDFSAVNKLHGMIAGDQVLAGFAELLGRQVRGSDLAGR